MRAARGGFWPTREQTLLLRAALLTGPPAIAAYRSWRPIAVLDRLDLGSRRLLPLLARNLEHHGIRDPDHARLDEICREARSRNVLLMARLRLLVASLLEAGLHTMVLKGAALLLLRYYSEVGLRPMSDLDLLVPSHEAGRAMALLRRAGWSPPLEAPERVVPVTHSLLFRDTDGVQLDLHWHVLWECCGPGMDDDFWTAATATAVDGAPTKVLCPADQLFHACVHGVAWNPVPPLRWIADAMLILRATPDLAWDRLVQQARRRRLVLPLLSGIAFLRDVLDAPVPDGTLAALRALPVSSLEQLEFRTRARPWGRFGALPRLFCHHLRLRENPGHPRGLLGFPRYLQRLYGLPHLRDLPPELWKRFRQKSGGRPPNNPRARSVDRG